jgi:hypothetical protein
VNHVGSLAPQDIHPQGNLDVAKIEFGPGEADKERAMRETKKVERMKTRYRRLAERLGRLDLVLQGTITERTIVRDDPKRPGGKRDYGPYYQWTWKKKGKTVTVNLSKSQSKVYQNAIDNHRNLEAILNELRSLSLAILEATTEGVKKRKDRSERTSNERLSGLS